MLENQAWIPVSVLGRLWELDIDETMDAAHLFSEISLSSFRSSSESSGEAGIVLHDLQLEFCQEKATKSNKSSRWHAQLLNGYVEATDQPRGEENACATDAVLNFAPRLWWSPVRCCWRGNGRNCAEEAAVSWHLRRISTIEKLFTPNAEVKGTGIGRRGSREKVSKRYSMLCS